MTYPEPGLGLLVADVWADQLGPGARSVWVELVYQALKWAPPIGHNVGFQAPISTRSAREVERSTRRVWGAVELKTARKLTKNDVEVIAPAV